MASPAQIILRNNSIPVSRRSIREKISVKKANLRTNNTNNTADLEKQQISRRDNNEDDRARLAGLECLFGYPEDHLQQWPGAMAYCRFLEEGFQPLMDDEYAFIWNSVGEQRPQRAVQCWSWFNVICRSVRKLSDDSSIEDIWDDFVSSDLAKNGAGPNAVEKTACLIAVFAVLCWGSMTLQPKLQWPDFKSSSCLMIQQPHTNDCGLKMDIVRRPVSAAFRTFQRMISSGRWSPLINSGSTRDPKLLYLSTLNYTSLKTIGKIRIKWVEDLSSHLEFDPKNRSLSLFRFPSFCALNTLDTNRGAVFER